MISETLADMDRHVFGSAAPQKPLTEEGGCVLLCVKMFCFLLNGEVKLQDHWFNLYAQMSDY